MISINDIEFKPLEYKRLIDKLESITDINFKFYRDNFVAKRIKSRMIRLNLYDAKGYLNYIIENPEEIPKFLSGFTINTSYFFRNIEVFEKIGHIFKNSLNGRISKLANSKGKFNDNYFLSKNYAYYERERTPFYLKKMSIFKKIQNSLSKNSCIKIWSCACASGEEPYSLAMFFESIKNNIRNFPNYKIVASDIDRKALENASNGTYLEESLKGVPPFFKFNYFKKVDHRLGERFLLDEKIRKQIEFIREDVTKGHQKNNRYDIIFCRYFLIYTDKKTRGEILHILEKQLVEGGLLVLGKTETLFHSYENLKLVDSKNHIYIKDSINQVQGN